MTTFEIIILGAIYIFAMLVETGFQIEDSVSEKICQMRTSGLQHWL